MLVDTTLNIAASKGNAFIVKMLLDYSRQYLRSDNSHLPLDKHDFLDALDDAAKNKHFHTADPLLDELLDKCTDCSIEDYQDLLAKNLWFHYPRGIDAALKISGIFQHPSNLLNIVLISAVENDYSRVVEAIFDAKAPISPDTYQKVCEEALEKIPVK